VFAQSKSLRYSLVRNIQPAYFDTACYSSPNSIQKQCLHNRNLCVIVLFATFNRHISNCSSWRLSFVVSFSFTTHQSQSTVSLNQFPIAQGEGGGANKAERRMHDFVVSLLSFPSFHFRRFSRMRKGMRIITILSLLVIGVMLLAACGGGAATPAPAAEAPAVEAPAEEAAPTEAPAEEAAPTEAPAEEAAPTERA
jgi:hypothetical protein